MRVLGVDPGLTRCGVGVVDGAWGGRSGWWTPPWYARRRTSRSGGGCSIADAMADAIACTVPTWWPLSGCSPAQRPHMGTAQVAGLAIVAATRAGMPVALHTPSEVKAAIAGSGTPQGSGERDGDPAAAPADGPRPADAADALALAICQSGAAARPDQRRCGRRAKAGDRQRARRGLRARAGRRGHRGRRRRPRGLVLARDARSAAGRARPPGWPPAWSCARTR